MKRSIRVSRSRTGVGRPSGITDPDTHQVPLTQHETALLLGISVRAVREDERRAFEKIRRHPAMRTLWRQYAADKQRRSTGTFDAPSPVERSMRRSGKLHTIHDIEVPDLEEDILERLTKEEKEAVLGLAKSEDEVRLLLKIFRIVGNNQRTRRRH